MALSNGLRYAIALLLLLSAAAAAAAARLLQEASPGNFDYTTNEAAKFAVNYQQRIGKPPLNFCEVLGATHQTNGDSSEYSLSILAQDSNGVRWICIAKVRISTDPDAVPKLDFFLQSTKLPRLEK